MSVSPFQKKRIVFQREKSAAESFKEYFTQKLKDMFLDNLPSDDIKAMSPEYLYPIGMFALVCLVGIFLAVFLNGFYTSAKTRFLSPYSGNVAKRNCETIPTTNTGTYLATEGGLWQGANGFQFEQAAYELTLTSLSMDYDEYVSVMNKAYTSLQGVKELSYTFDLASNLVYWMSGTFLPIDGNVAQRFFFVGTPLVVFDRQKTIGTVANVDGRCNVSSKATFDANSGKLSLIYDYDQFMAEPMCTNALDPELVGYVASTDFHEFAVEFDVRSMITCVAVNLGIMGVDSLIKIPAFDTYVNYSGVIYNISSYYDPKYNNMDPITCMQVPSNQTYAPPGGYTQCVVLIEHQVYAIPMFNHVGQSPNFPVYCNCSTLTYEQINDKFDPCNIFYFMSGVLFYNTTAPYDIMELFLKVGLTPTSTGLSSTLNSDSYYALWIDSYFGINSPNRSDFNTPEQRAAAYSFCDLPDSTSRCTFMIFTHFDRNPNTWAISDYYYQLQTGACQNSFVGSQEEWEALIDQPFAPLTQDYQKCSYDTSTIVVNQAGSSVGTVSILAPICITFILVMVYFAQVCGVASIKKTYTNTEKADALADLALKLLVARDKDKANLDKDSVIAKLVEELGRELDSTDEIYHSSLNTNDNEKVSIDWAALQTSVGLKKRQPSMQMSVDGAPGYPSLMRGNPNGAGSGSAGVEMKPVGSPIHFLAPLGTGAQKRENCIIMNDYEVTPALMQLCGTVPALRKSPKVMKRKESVTTAASGAVEDGMDDRMESGEGKQETETEAKEARKQLKDSMRLDVPALFALMDKLADELDAAQSDRSKNVWSVAGQTAIFRTVQVYALSSKDCATLYYKMYTLLALHAAAVLNVSVEEVKSDRAGGVGYIVGNKVLTLAEIRMKL